MQNEIDRQLRVSETAKKFLEDVWEFLQRVKVFDSGIQEKGVRDSDEVLLDEFSYTLARIAERTCYAADASLFGAEYDGICILIDEADNCSSQLGLGSFFKLLLERLQKRGCDRVLVGLAGLPELRSKLYESHPSSVRVFNEVPLERLANRDVASIVDICMSRASQENTEKTSINNDAKELLISLSEGYPHFIQQFGYSAFAQDEDGVIDTNDVGQGAFGPHGALNLIGDRYYRNDFYNKIQKDSYRQVLRIMADDLDAWVTKEKIKAKFKGTDATLNNALKALRDRHIILSKEGERGVYRLQHRGFALWIKLYADPDFLDNLLSQLQVSDQSVDKGPTTHERDPSAPETK